MSVKAFVRYSAGLLELQEFILHSWSGQTKKQNVFWGVLKCLQTHLRNWFVVNNFAFHVSAHAEEINGHR